MYNLGSYKSKAVRDAIRAGDARLWFLAPYSPDLNPIEQTFSKIMHFMRIAQNEPSEKRGGMQVNLSDQSHQKNAQTISKTLDTPPSKTESV